MKKSLAILLVAVFMLSFAWTASAVSVGTPTATVNGTEVTVTGTITDGASNQQITIMVVTDGVARASATESDIAYINQDTFAGNSYTFTFEMPDSMTTGTYDVYVGGTGVSTPVETSFTLGSSPTEAPTEAPTEVPATAAPSGATVTGTTDVDTDKYTVTATANGDPVDITISEGTYTISLPAAGTYEIVVSAPTAIAKTFTATVSGTTYTGPEISLIFGDFNGDSAITATDVSAVMGKIGATGADYVADMDLNGDGAITATDVSAVMGKIGSTYSAN